MLPLQASHWRGLGVSAEESVMSMGRDFGVKAAKSLAAGALGLGLAAGGGWGGGLLPAPPAAAAGGGAGGWPAPPALVAPAAAAQEAFLKGQEAVPAGAREPTPAQVQEVVEAFKAFDRKASSPLLLAAAGTLPPAEVPPVVVVDPALLRDLAGEEARIRAEIQQDEELARLAELQRKYAPLKAAILRELAEADAADAAAGRRPAGSLEEVRARRLAEARAAAARVAEEEFDIEG